VIWPTYRADPECTPKRNMTSSGCSPPSSRLCAVCPFVAKAATKSRLPRPAKGACPTKRTSQLGSTTDRVVLHGRDLLVGVVSRSPVCWTTWRWMSCVASSAARSWPSMNRRCGLSGLMPADGQHRDPQDEAQREPGAPTEQRTKDASVTSQVPPRHRHDLVGSRDSGQ
jgi:hypothetical protein